MKKNWIMRISLIVLILTLGTACALGGTFARYSTEAKGSDSARVAHWGFTKPTTVSLDVFSSIYNDGTNYDAKSNNGDDIIAPGTTKTASFEIISLTGTPEVDYSFGISVDGSEIDNDIKNNPSILWRLDDNAYGSWDDMLADILALSGDASGLMNYKAGTAPTMFDKEHTISWKWDFESQKDFVYAPEKDTWLADLTTGKGDCLKIKNMLVDDIPTFLENFKDKSSLWDITWNGVSYNTYAVAITAWSELNSINDILGADKYTTTYNKNAGTTKAVATEWYTNNAPDVAAWKKPLKITDSTYSYNVIESTELYVSYAEAKAAYDVLPKPTSNKDGSTTYNLFGEDYTEFEKAMTAYKSVNPDNYKTDWDITWNDTKYPSYADAMEDYGKLNPDDIRFECASTWDAANPTAMLTLDEATDRYNSAAFKPVEADWTITIDYTDELDYKYTFGTFTSPVAYTEEWNNTVEDLETLQKNSYHDYNDGTYNNYKDAKAAFDQYVVDYNTAKGAGKYEADLAGIGSQNVTDTAMGNKGIVGSDVNYALLDTVKIVITVTATQINPID